MIKKVNYRRVERKQKKIKKYIMEEWKEDKRRLKSTLQKNGEKTRRVKRRLEEWKEDKR